MIEPRLLTYAKSHIRDAIAKAIAQLVDIDVEIAVKACYPHDRYIAHYNSNVSFGLANLLHREPLQLAAELCERIQAVSTKFTVNVAGKGWLNFCLTDAFLAECLSSLSELDTAELPVTNKQNFPGYTYVQYAYARCHSLMRLAASQGLLGEWKLLDAEGRLLLKEESELRLALQCLAIGDRIPRLPERFDPPAYGIPLKKGDSINSSSPNFLQSKHEHSHRNQDSDSINSSSPPFLKGGWGGSTPSNAATEIKLCRSLSTNFLEFSDRCQIFSVAADLALARIGLVNITQKLIGILASSYIDLPEIL